MDTKQLTTKNRKFEETSF